MTVHALTGDKRTITGKAVKKLRSQGILPVTIYGKGMESLMVQLHLDEFEKLFASTGHSTVVEITVGSAKYPCLIASVQRDPVTHRITHSELRMVNMKEKINATVPIEFTGEPIAIKEAGGVLLTITNQVEVEALPNDLPERFTVDVTGLKTIGDQLLVSDIVCPKNVTVVSEPDIVIAKITEKAKEEEIAEPVPEETAPAETESATVSAAPAEESEAK